MFDGVLSTSMLRKAEEKKIAQFIHINLRDFGKGPRKTVDDTPYGGGDGMLLQPTPLVEAIESALKNDPGALVIFCLLYTSHSYLSGIAYLSIW